MRNLWAKLISLITRGVTKGSQVSGKNGYVNSHNSMSSSAIAQVYYPYGFAANAPAETLNILLKVNGSGANQCALPYHTPSGEFKMLSSGEVMIGNLMTNQFIKFSSDGNIIIEGNIKITGMMTITGDVIIDGDLTVTGTINNAGCS